ALTSASCSPGNVSEPSKDSLFHAASLKIRPDDRVDDGQMPDAAHIHRMAREVHRIAEGQHLDRARHDVPRCQRRVMALHRIGASGGGRPATMLAALLAVASLAGPTAARADAAVP